MECLTRWILFLSRNGIKKLVLKENQRPHPYQTPSHIFSCQELTYLELHNFKLSTAPKFRGFKSLVDLHLYGIIFESGALQSLVSGCPLLVKLTIFYCSGFEHFNVCAPTLKVLNMVSDKVIKSICLKEAQNLIDLTLWADGDGDNFEEGWVSDLLKGLMKIERLTLEKGFLKAVNPQVLLRLVDTLKYLELNDVNFNEEGELPFIISLLESSSNLKELIIQSYNEAVEPQMILEEFDCNDCCFSQLQIVKITVKTDYKNALNLIRFVLAKSSSLKILTFQVDLGLKKLDAPILLSISRDLLQMKRASPGAEVNFLYHGLI